MAVQMELHKIIISEMAEQQIIWLKEVDGERSSSKTKHPFLTDPAVRQAMLDVCGDDAARVEAAATALSTRSCR